MSNRAGATFSITNITSRGQLGAQVSLDASGRPIAVRRSPANVEVVDRVSQELRSYAGVGGAEQRLYPWSSPPSSDVVSTSEAVYSADPFHPAFTAPSEVGSLPKGVGAWTHADLGGNVTELVLDTFEKSPPPSCVDCASVNYATNSTRVLIGGGYAGDATYLQNAYADIHDVPDRSSGIGGRCARDK